MLKPQRDAVLDALEVVETSADHLWTWFAVVAGPSTKAADDPGCEGERASGVRVLLPCCLAFELRRDSFEDRLVGRLESIGEALAGRAIAGFDELHHGDGSHRGGSDELDHDLRIADVGRLDVEARGLERVEELLDGPAQPIKIDDPASLAKACNLVRRQKPPVDRLAI